MYIDSRVAQLVERSVVTREVGSSMLSPGAKKCFTCSKNKSKNEFHKQADHSDGLQSYCKNCNKFKIHQYRAELKAKGIHYRWNSKEYMKELRRKVIDLIGGPICAECGCDEFRILEINHIEGGGTREHKEKRYKKMLCDIVYGRVDAKKYNVLCRVCNAAHYVSSLLGIPGHRVIWQHARSIKDLERTSSRKKECVNELIVV